MRKRLIFWLIILFAATFGVVVIAYPSVPSDDEVLNLIQTAESIYHPYNNAVLSTVIRDGRLQGEFFLRNNQDEIVAFYDEVQGYEENVPQVFTENGICELENAYCCSSLWFLKRDGKIYRRSGMTVADSNNYFNGEYNPNPSHLRLTSRTWNSFTYEVSTTPRYVWGDLNPIVTTLTVAYEDGKLKMEQFNYPACSRYDEYYTEEELLAFTIGSF